MCVCMHVVLCLSVPVLPCSIVWPMLETGKREGSCKCLAPRVHAKIGKGVSFGRLAHRTCRWMRWTRTCWRGLTSIMSGPSRYISPHGLAVPPGSCEETVCPWLAWIRSTRRLEGSAPAQGSQAIPASCKHHNNELVSCHAGLVISLDANVGILLSVYLHSGWLAPQVDMLLKHEESSADYVTLLHG